MKTPEDSEDHGESCAASEKEQSTPFNNIVSKLNVFAFFGRFLFQTRHTAVMMPVPLRVTEYLARHPHDVNITFSFPDDRQLGANRMLLSASCEAFEAMFSGDWKEETVINLPDTNLEAFELFTRILYSESVDLGQLTIFTHDKLYYLADKYMVEEIKVNITDEVKHYTAPVIVGPWIGPWIFWTYRFCSTSRLTLSRRYSL